MNPGKKRIGGVCECPKRKASLVLWMRSPPGNNVCDIYKCNVNLGNLPDLSFGV